MTDKKKRITADDLSAQLGKLPPQAIDLERAVLGAILLEREAIDQVSFLKSSDFYTEAHQAIYNAVIELMAQSKPIDLLTVTSRLRADGKLEMVGGPYYVTEITTMVNSAANIETHARIIQQNAMRRELISLTSELQRDAYDDTEDVFELLDKADADLMKINTQAASDVINLGDANVIMKRIQEIEAAKAKRARNEVVGVPSGFTSIDRETGGFKKSDLIIVAARPGMGKSSWVFSIAHINAVWFKRPIGIFSLEMSTEQIHNRIISMETEIPANRLANGDLMDHEVEQIIHKSQNLINAPIIIDDTAGISIMQLRARARVMMKKYKIELLIVDYLQLMDGNRKSGENREVEVSNIARGLKRLAKDLDIPVIALSQLSRAVETRGGDKRPMLSDLRESGCLHGDTLIYCPTERKIVPIRELVGKQFSVLSTDGAKVYPVNAKKCFSNGHKEVFELKLVSGRTIKATGNHLFLTNNGMWKPVSSLMGEKIAIPFSFSAIDRHEISDDEIELVGHFIANGSAVKKQGIRYCCNQDDRDLANRVCSAALLATESKVSPKISIPTNKRVGYVFNITFPPTFRLTHGVTHPIADILRKYNLFDKRAGEKFIPNEFHFLSDRKKCILLKALFSGDGCAYYREIRGRKQLRILYSSKSKRLISGIQMLLQEVGILSAVRETSNGKFTWHNLSIDGKANVTIFIEKVGFFNERKQRIASDGVNKISGNREGWTKFDIHEGEELCYYEVEEINSIGVHEVFDIEVPVLHNFTADGIIAHNSIEQEADMVMFLYRPEYYGITQTEDGSPTTGLGEVIIAKFRNGNPASTWMKFVGKFTKWMDLNGSVEVGKKYADPPDAPSIHSLPGTTVNLPYKDSDETAPPWQQ